MSARSKTKIQSSGREHASADQVPVRVKPDYDGVVGEMAVLHSGARLAAKLNAKIIVNDSEFNHAGEMSVDDRHLYHEALEAVFPPDIATSSTETAKIGQKKGLLVAVVVSLRRSFSSLAPRFLRLKR